MKFSKPQCNYLDAPAQANHNKQWLDLIRGIMCSATEKTCGFWAKDIKVTLHRKLLKGEGDRLPFLLVFHAFQRYKVMLFKYTDCTCYGPTTNLGILDVRWIRMIFLKKSEAAKFPNMTSRYDLCQCPPLEKITKSMFSQICQLFYSSFLKMSASCLIL